MTQRDRDPSAEIPEADLNEQLTPVDDVEEQEPDPLDTAADHVNEADWIDQQKPVPLDDDDMQ